MRFFKLDESVIKSSNPNPNTKLKIEYFWHYWDFLFTENRSLILVNEPKFVSHISLIDKVIKHLKWNNGISPKKLSKYFNQHVYFNKSNLILRSESNLKAEVLEVKRFIETIERDVDEKYLSDQNRKMLKSFFTNLKTKYFLIEEYSEVLINKLHKLFISEKELTDLVKKDLKFLSNSLIDILVIKGYSIDFIQNVLSKVVFSSSSKFEFSYPKRYIDFNRNFDEWSAYANEEFKKLKLFDRLEYLKKLLIQEKRVGYYIFKIEGVDFQSKPIEVFQSTFYNPNTHKYLKFYRDFSEGVTDEDREYYNACEFFILGKKESQKKSTCNLIVPIEYFLEDIGVHESFKYPPKSYVLAKINARVSLLQFRRYLKVYSTEHYFDEGLGEIRLTNESILVDKDFNYHSTSNSFKLKKMVFKLDGVRENMLSEQLDYKSNIKSKSLFLRHLASSNVLLSEMSLENHKFNYKSLWIECVEPYFKDIDEFIVYAQKSIRIRTNLFSNYRILLNNGLRCNGVFCNSYCLSNEKLDEIGIGNLKIGDKIYGDLLEEKFEAIPTGSILCEFKDEMRAYVNSEKLFLSKIDKWIDEVVKITYDERNIEVHYNLVDYYNDISIKKDIVFICSAVIGAFNDAVSKLEVLTSETAKEYIDLTLAEQEGI